MENLTSEKIAQTLLAMPDAGERRQMLNELQSADPELFAEVALYFKRQAAQP